MYRSHPRVDRPRGPSQKPRLVIVSGRMVIQLGLQHLALGNCRQFRFLVGAPDKEKKFLSAKPEDRPAFFVGTNHRLGDLTDKDRLGIPWFSSSELALGKSLGSHRFHSNDHLSDRSSDMDCGLKILCMDEVMEMVRNLRCSVPFMLQHP